MSARTPVAGLPLGGPATLPGVKAQLGIPTDDQVDDARLTDIVNALNPLIRSWPCSEDAAAPDTLEADREWPPNVTLGADMLAGRYFRRKDNPDGLMVMGDGAVAYLRRTDPDIAMLLGLGGAARPQAR